MLEEIKNNLELSLSNYINNLDKTYQLSKISPLLHQSIKNFISRKGKRLRPLLFCLSYLGYSKKPAKGLYESALALELTHNFLLIHDDIIDKSDLRRGEPSMHEMMNNFLKGYKPDGDGAPSVSQNISQSRQNIKFSGDDLAIVIGDIIYALAVNLFLTIDEKKARKEKAAKKFSEIVIYTGAGQFIELLYGAQNISRIKKEDIYKIYDLKTAYYSFSYPLSLGAVLAGEEEKELRKLFEYGRCLGRAFQIKDDILNLFAPEKETGKPALTDLKEAKKTILLQLTYQKLNPKNRSRINKTLSKKHLDSLDLTSLREIISESGSLKSAEQEISCYLDKAKKISASLKMRPRYKNLIESYTAELLKV